jgi:Uma2 family endonuclease
MTVKVKKLTYEDYAKLPEGAPYQLIDGMLVKSPVPEPYHQGLSGRLHILFNELVKKGKGKAYYSPIDIYLSETETYQPDLIFIRKEREHIIGKKKIEGPPDIVVEILSPSNAYYDLRHKRKIYEEKGVPEFWIVDPPEEAIEIYVNGPEGFYLHDKAEKEGRVASSLYPELVVDLTEFFTDA